MAVDGSANVLKSVSAISRTADGKSDLSGIWQTLSTAECNLEPHNARKNAPAGLGVVEGTKSAPPVLKKVPRKFRN